MKAKVRLPRNVQFIYEHSLAREELEKGFHASRIKWDSSDPWTFSVSLNGQKEEIIRRSAYAGLIDGTETVYSQLIKPAYQGGRFNRTRSVNQYLTHWIYPYKGKFHPQMIRALLNISGARPGWRFFEPFCGSGTAALEAQLAGLEVLAVDVSPLCVLLTFVKTHAWKHSKEIKKHVDEILAAGRRYHEVEVVSSHRAVRAFFEIAKMVTLSDVSNRGRLPEISYPKNLGAMLESITAMSKARDEFAIEFGKVECREEDVRSPTEETLRWDADIIITSPPYSLALDYVKNDQHALSAMGLDLKAIRDQFIGVAGSGVAERASRYEKDMNAALNSMSRVLKRGGIAIVIIGNVTIAKEERYTIKDFVGWAREAGFVLEKELPKIVYGLYNMIDDEKILFFRRE